MAKLLLKKRKIAEECLVFQDKWLGSTRKWFVLFAKK
jgi:hypothetical protein